MDVIKVADYVFDMGPEGGMRGGQLVCEGTPEQVAENKKSITAQFLKKELVAGKVKVKEKVKEKVKVKVKEKVKVEVKVKEKVKEKVKAKEKL